MQNQEDKLEERRKVLSTIPARRESFTGLTTPYSTKRVWMDQGAQLDVAADRLKSVESMKDETREDAIKRGLDAQDYVDAKRDFESDEQVLKT